jgi:hypothetical protein
MGACPADSDLALGRGVFVPVGATLAIRFEAENGPIRRHIHRGERIADLEKQFGSTIPEPDPYPAHGATQYRISNGKAYYYLSGAGVCWDTFDGLAVRTDDHGFITSWNRITAYESCYA